MGPRKFIIFGESGGTSRPMTRASFFATLLLNANLRCYRLHGGCGFEFTSGGSCGRACIIPPKSRGYLPPVGQRYLCLTAWGVYLRWFRLHSAGVHLSIPSVAPADVPAIPAQNLGHLPAVLQTFTCGAETRLPSGGCIPAVRLFAFNF